MSDPDWLDVRAYHAAMKRHRDAAAREAADLQRLAERIVKELRHDGRATTSDGRSALHTAGLLQERLIALETLRQDAEHFILPTPRNPQ